MNKINNFLTIFFIIIVGTISTNAQHFELYSSTEFQGVFYGDCAVININDDSYPEFITSGAVTGYGTGHTSLYLNNQGEASLLEEEFSLIMYSSIAVGDINGDGLEDFAIMGVKNQPGTTQGQVFEIYYNNGDNTFTKNDSTGITPASYGSLKIADLNGDGIADFFVNGISGTTYISKIYFQDEEGNFTESENSLIGTYFSASEVFDANGDGLLDILVTGFNTSFAPSATLYINQGNGNFTSYNSGIGGVYFSSVSTGDFDGDGNIDVLVSGMDTSFTASLVLYINDGEGNFTPSSFEFSGTYSGASALVDYNNDGLLDVFSIGAGEGNQNKTLFYLNDGNGSFVEDTANSQIIGGLNMSKAKWFDFNNDGTLDLLIIGFEGNTEAKTSLYINTINDNQAPQYCDPFESGGNTSCLYNGGITNFTFAGINKDSECSGDNFSYADYTSEVAEVQQNGTYQLTVTMDNPSANSTVAVWIDFNQNGIFEEEEFYSLGTTTESSDSYTFTTQILIPEQSVLGNTRIRVRSRRGNGEFEYFNACGAGTTNTNSFANRGEVEDYSLVILEAVEEVNEYCIPEVFLVNPISYVEFGTIQNPSSAEFDVPAGYEDFTDISTDVVKGDLYTLKVEGYTGGYEEYVEAYFDWNQNGEFEDSELYEVGVLQPSMGNDGVFVSLEIQIPSTALLGNTRMRIYKKYFTYLDACEETDFGQVEDYTINVIEQSIEEDLYCEVTLEEEVEPITYVQFSTVTKETSNVLGEGDVYENFTELVADVTKGNSYTLTIKGNTDGPVQNIVRAYIDWDQDGEFDSQTESYTVGYLQNSNGLDDISVSLSIEIPENAILGNTRMRIVKDADDYNMSPCQMVFYGQVEDYTVNILEATSGTDTFEANIIGLYPNPTNGWFTIKTNLNITEVIVFNITGQQILQSKDSQIDLSNFSSGVYLVKIISEEGKVFNHKVIKN